MNQLIVGFGEIGRAVKEAICPDAETYDASDEPFDHLKFSDVDVLHICFPYDDSFKQQVADYITAIKPKHIIVYSTVPIGTCRSISEKIVHSPVEGRHSGLADSIKNSYRWVGFNDGNEGRFFVDYFEDRKLKVWFVASTETTELAKIRSTAKYGINLVWAQYETELCEKFGVAYDQVMAFDQHYNETYRSDPNINRYILYPPNGVVGGHCVTQNAKLLNEQFPSELLQRIIDMEVK